MVRSRVCMLFALCVLGLVGSALAVGVPLENWRLPLYAFAAQRGDYRSSPSGLFWDWQTTPPPVLNRMFWPDSARSARHYWALEPSFALQGSNTRFAGGDWYNIQMDIHSEVVLGPLAVRTSLDVDRQYSGDDSYPWHQERAMAGRIEEAYGQVSNEHAMVRFGRLNRNWGPWADHSILLSNAPFTYDALEFGVTWRQFEFRHLFGAFPLRGEHLDGVPQSPPGVPKSPPAVRYLTGHALNFIIGDIGAVGVSETVLFGRPDGLPDFQYVNPFSIYSVINTNGEGSGNLMLGVQGWAHPVWKKATVRAQVVFDDFQVDNDAVGDLEPTHWAGEFGVSVRDFLPLPVKHHASLDYRYLSKWMYTVTAANTVKGERYSYLGTSLGYPGQDGDELKLTLGGAGNDFWVLSMSASYGRQDTCNLTTTWPKPTSSDALGYRKEAPLSERSDLEETVAIGLVLNGYFRDIALLRVELENRWIRNESHSTPGGFKGSPRISAQLSLHYGRLFFAL